MSRRSIHPRQKILNASLKLFVDRGYFNTNIPSICKQSGCPVGSIYHYFKNKEEIAVLLYEDCIETVVGGLTEAVLAADSYEQQVAAAISYMVYFVEKNPSRARYVMLARHNEFIRTSLPTMMGAFIKHLGPIALVAIQDEVAAGRVKPLSPELMLIGMSAPILRYCQSWLDGDFQTKPSDVVDDLIRLSLDALAVH